MSEPSPEKGRSKGKTRAIDVLSDETMDLYRDGVNRMALTLDHVIQEGLSQGKRPTILVPYRGPVPLIIGAVHALHTLDSQHILSDSQRTTYYPDAIPTILSTLETGKPPILPIPTTPPDESQIDVIFYPSTADVLQRVGEKVNESRGIRASTVRGLLQMIEGRYETNPSESIDFLWQLFLLGKVTSNEQLDINQVIQSYKRIPQVTERQYILFDASISGRAATNLIEAFTTPDGSPISVVPILASDLDRTGEPRLEDKYRHRIEAKTAWQYIGTAEAPFIRFPIISEDRGPEALGVETINFSDFNRSETFREAGIPLSEGSFMQSTVVLPATPEDLAIFHAFITKVLDPQANISNWNEVEQAIVRRGTRGIVATPSLLPIMKQYFPQIIDHIQEARVTSSGIISIKLDQQTIREWLLEFRGALTTAGVQLSS